jgi:MAF protein
MPPQPASPTIVLASASPRRRELLAALGVSFVVRPAGADETAPAGASPEAAARTIAERKARVVRTSGRDVVLAADTIVVLDGRVLGKPEDATAARAMLAALCGRVHTVVTAVALATARECTVENARTQVQMRAYTPFEIEASIAAGTPFDKAGAYAIQDPLLHPVDAYAGCYCNVMGLPLWTVHRLLSGLRPSVGAEPPDRRLARCGGCPLR